MATQDYLLSMNSAIFFVTTEGHPNLLSSAKPAFFIQQKIRRVTVRLRHAELLTIHLVLLQTVKHIMRTLDNSMQRFAHYGLRKASLHVTLPLAASSIRVAAV